MRRKLSILEILVLASHTGFLYNEYVVLKGEIRTFDTEKKQYFMLVLTCMIFLFKKRVEGNKWNVIFFMSSFILSLFHKIFHMYSSIEVTYISVTLTFLYFITIACFPVYGMPRLYPLNEGNFSHDVSCTHFKISASNSNVTLFYPSQEGYSENSEQEINDNIMQSQGDSLYHGDDILILPSDYWKHIYAALKQHFFMPSSLLNLFLSYYKNYPLKLTSNLPLIKSKTPLKPIIFSHGFLASRNAYSIILRHLASLGYAVFSVEHYDVVKETDVDKEKDSVKKRMLFKQIKERELDQRVEKIKIIIDLIENRVELEKLFGQTINIDTQNIVLMGHSYGGATVHETSIKYPKHVKAVVCLDPWFFPMRDEFLSLPSQVPLLFINSETFADKMPWAEIRKRNTTVMENGKCKDKSLNCLIKDMDHIQQGDICLLFPRETQLAGMIRYPERTLEFNLYNVKLIELFLANIVFPRNQIQMEDFHALINSRIFVPMKRDSFQYFRQEFIPTWDHNANMYYLKFKGNSPL